MRPERESPIPSAAEVDHAWIRRHLGWRLTGQERIDVRSISHSDGMMGSVHQVRCGERSFVLKGPPDDRSAWGNLLTDIGRREVEFYRYLAARGPAAPKVSPDCHWSALGPDGLGALALEDVGPPAGFARTMAAGLSRSAAAAAVRCLALFHAASARRGADPLAPPYPWLYSARSDALVAAVRMGLDELPRLAAGFGTDGPSAEALRALADLDVERALADSHTTAGITSLCHGDCWAANVLFAPAGAPPERQRALLIDWQFAMWGNPLTDVALFLLSSLAPEARRAWQDDLLGIYRTTLTEHCALPYPAEECRADYDRALPFAGLVALATLEDYLNGMSPAERQGFAGRVRDCADAGLRRQSSDVYGRMPRAV